jgi:hypothetical protein
MTRIADGEYILATRFSDGQPMDPWAFGFLRRSECFYGVVDNAGNLIGYFKRAQRITKEFGDFLSNNIQMIETSNRSLWWWKLLFEGKLNYQKLPEGKND